MTVSDAQVALGILQLVALALPALAMFSQVYFSVSDEATHFIMGLFILGAGVLLILAGVMSAQYLHNSMGESLVSASLIYSAGGLVFIGIVIYFIYLGTKSKSEEKLREKKSEKREIQNIVLGLLEDMEEKDVDNIEELRQKGVEVDDDINDKVTKRELEEATSTLEERLNALDIIYNNVGFSPSFLYKFENNTTDYLKNPYFPATLVTVGLYIASLYYDIFDASSPIGIAILSSGGIISAAVLGWLYPWHET